MINVNDKILTHVNESEMWLLLHITKRLGKKMFCWPSNQTLMNDTGWSIDKLRIVKKSLIDKKLISVEIKEGTSNIYHVETDLLGVFVSADRLSDTPSEKPTTPPRKNQHGTPSEKPTHKYYQSEVLTSNNIGASAQDTIEKRKKEFEDTIRPFVKQYGSQMCNEFYQYWSEASKNGKTLRWEKQSTWEIKLRLSRWKKNHDEKMARRPGIGQAVTPSTVIKKEGTDNQQILDQLYSNSNR